MLRVRLIIGLDRSHPGRCALDRALRSEPTGVDQTQQIAQDRLEAIEIRHLSGLLVADEQIQGGIGKPLRPTFIDPELPRGFEHDTVPQLIDFGLDGGDIGVYSAPCSDRTLCRVIQMQCYADQSFDASTGIRFDTQHLQLRQRAMFFPVGDQLTAIVAPTGKEVIKGARRDSKPAAHLGEFQVHVPLVGENLQAHDHIVITCHDESDRPYVVRTLAIGLF